MLIIYHKHKSMMRIFNLKIKINVCTYIKVFYLWYIKEFFSRQMEKKERRIRNRIRKRVANERKYRSRKWQIDKTFFLLNAPNQAIVSPSFYLIFFFFSFSFFSTLRIISKRLREFKYSYRSLEPFQTKKKTVHFIPTISRWKISNKMQ